VRSTPPLPNWIVHANFAGYENVFKILDGLPEPYRTENSTRLYGTETLPGFGDWSARILVLSKDAGPSSTFRSLVAAGDRQPWRHACPTKDDRKGVQTNVNLRELTREWCTTYLYGSCMANLLRADGQQSGPLPGFDDPALQAHVCRVLTWTIAELGSSLQAIVCLGGDAWKTLGRALGIELPKTLDRGKPYDLVVAGHNLRAFRMFHTSRAFSGGRVARQAEWNRIADVLCVPRQVSL